MTKELSGALGPLETNIANIVGNVDLGDFLQEDLNAIVEAAQKLLAIQELYEAGYRLVPGKITKEMHDAESLAACGIIIEANNNGYETIGLTRANRSYKAMLAAAPDKLGEILNQKEK